MRQAAKRGLLTAMATGSVLASTAGYAYADAGAAGAAVGSPGVGSGNTVQVPVEAPVNACGNSVNVVGLLNPAFGNHCANVSPAEHHGHHGWHPGHHHGPGSGGGASHGSESGGGGGSSWSSAGGAHAGGVAAGSPGVASGNNAQVPVDVPVNACGNSVNVVGVGNPAFGNECANVSGETGHPHHPGHPCHHHGHPTPPPNGGSGHSVPPQVVTPASHMVAPPAPEAGTPQLAHTGADDMGLYAGAGAAMVAAGAVLYRRARTSGR